MEHVLLEIEGDATDVHLFRDAISGNGQILEVKTPANNGDQLYFDITDPETIKVMLESAVVLNTLIAAIKKWFMKPNRKRIVIKTPHGSATFEAAGELDEKGVRDKLQSLVKVISK